MQSLQRAIGPVLPLATARERGLPRYFNGLPCPKGHISERITSQEWCLECKRLSEQRRRTQHRAADPLHRAVESARASTVGQLSRIRTGIKNNFSPSRHTQATLPQLKAHIEARFQPGMTWENYGTVWECDHIRPQTAWDLSDPEQFRLCWSWRNLQPLFILQNRDKGERWGTADRLHWLSRVRRLGHQGPLFLRPLPLP
jgi:hypothetical protein